MEDPAALALGTATWIRAHPERRAQVRIATTIYPPESPEAITAAVGTAWQNLAVDYVDLLYLHKWDDDATTTDTLRALDALRRQGLVCALRLSNARQAQPASALAVQQQKGFTAFSRLQHNHNFAVRAAGPELCRFGRTQGVQVITPPAPSALAS
jgi:aryl-alcohol dehydrogenase-like predicted oxidoreductase